MIYVVVWCLEQTFKTVLRNSTSNKLISDMKLDFPRNEVELIEILNFNMPDILLINFSDKRVKSGNLNVHLEQDSWLHQFGTIGIYNRSVDNEEEIFNKYPHFNILALIEEHRVKSLLLKSIGIIEENKQLVFQGIIAGRLIQKLSGSFVIDNRDYLLAPVYGALLATCLVRMQKIVPEKKRDLQMALSEIIFNAIEHGNCGISYAEKSKWLAKGKSMNELILERCQLSRVAEKAVNVGWIIGDEMSEIIVQDEGRGFDIRAYREKVLAESNEQLNGRGIIMAQSVVDNLIYNSIGNKVRIEIKSQDKPSKNIPSEFAREEIINVKPGDVLMRVGEFADCLYYISSGVYSVYLNGKPVGKITNADIFMGEMAFLLNNTRTATVVAEVEGRVIRISRKSFMIAIKKSPQYAIFLSKVLARKLMRSNDFQTTDDCLEKPKKKSKIGLPIISPALTSALNR